jgi:hypothetical protein
LKQPPRFDEFPKLTSSKHGIAQTFSGKWFSNRGGTRLSYGTLLEIQDERVEVVEFTLAGRLRVGNIRAKLADGLLSFPLQSNGNTFEFQLANNGVELNALTSFGPTDRLVYQTATYNAVPKVPPAYLVSLGQIYDQFEAESAEDGLASALPRHVQRLKVFLGESRMVTQELDEWDLILAAWHMEAIHDTGTAALYLKAAAQLFPQSTDVANELRKRNILVK